MVKICPSCNSENGDNSKFCKNCGEKLESSSSQVSSSQLSPKSEPKNNKNLIIGAAVIICAIIFAGAFMALNSSDSSTNSFVDGDSSGYYQYNLEGYTFNIPEGYEEVSMEDYSTLGDGFEDRCFSKDDNHYIFIGVANDYPGLSKELLDAAYNGRTLEDNAYFTYQEVWGKEVYRFTNSTIDCVIFGSGNDLISVLVCNGDLEPIISSINQKAIPSSSSSSSSDSMTYSEASSYLNGASSTVIQNTFDEADANGDGVLTGSEITKFKKLADLTERTADTSNSENVEAQDYGAGDGTTKTRYCTTHGRVAVGSDNRCPYCEAEGLDSRTVKGSTEYI